MKKNLLFTACAASLTCSAQQWQWGYPVSSDNLSFVSSVRTDSAGNPYFIGTSSNSVTFNAQNGSFPVQGLSMFVAKYNAAGNKIWISGGWGPPNSIGGKGSLDKHSNCYLTGSFAGTSSIGIGTDTLQRTSYQNTDDYYLAKLDKNGKALFFKTGGDSCQDGGSSVTTLSTDELISFWTDETFCTTMGSHTYVNYMNKLNSNGSQLW